MRLTGIDHLVLTVADLPRTIRWYTDTLQLEHIEQDGKHALRVGEQKINIHAAAHTFEPKAQHPTPGAGDLCIRTTTPIDTVIASLEQSGAVITAGPVQRTGALGAMTSVYVRDPDGNLIEIAHYN